MDPDYSLIFSQIGTCIAYCLPLSISIGLIERVISLVLDAALDRIRRRERI